LKSALSLLFCVAGIYAAFLTQGIVSEHLAMKLYGEQKERFRDLEALNGVQSLTCFLWAWLLLRFRSKNPKDYPKWTDYWQAGLSNSVGPALGMIALKNISYPAQVLAKSCKMVPVMLWGTILNGKRYSGLEYMCMAFVAAGVSLFATSGSSKVASKLAAPNAPLGYALCLGNLALDGFTNARQDRINHHHPKNSPIHMMCWMNFWCMLFYGLYMFGLSSIGMDLIAFCQRHPDAAWDVLLFCGCGAIGQLFIFHTIQTFGSLTNTVICTTRKFFNILLSVVWSMNPLLPMQWVAVSMVFLGLLVHTYMKSMKSRKQKKLVKKE
jgi:solute carrier family 35 (UDP-galactose transporter), member B1